MSEINNVQLREPDPIDFDRQTTGTTTVRPKMPPQGEYSLLPVGCEWGADRSGYLMGTMTFRVIDPNQPHDNYEMRYQRVSTKKWPSRESSSILDYLKAHGITARPSTNAEYQALVSSTLNRPFRAVVDWRAYDKASQETVKGMEQFPKRADGSFQPWITAKGGGDTKVFANVEVKFYKDAVS